MPEHLSVEQITKYGQGKLAPDEWPPVVAHLNECSTCFAVLRDLFPQRTNPQRHVLLSLRTPEEDDHWHLDFDAHLRPFVDGEADEVEREVIESHLSVCADCGQAMRELREFKDSLRLRQLERELDKEHAQQSQTPLATDSRHKLALWWRRLTAPASSLRVALSVSLLVLLCAGGLLWFKSRSSVPSQNIGTTQSTLNGDETISPAQPGQSQPGDLQARAPSNSSSPAVAQSTAPGTQIQDGTTQIILDQHGNLKGLESLPASVQEEVKRALHSQAFELPAMPAALAPPATHARGAIAPSSQAGQASPAWQVIRTDRPLFRWPTQEAGAQYEVTVFDERFNPIIVSPPLNETQWQPDKLMPRGRMLSWQVKISPHKPATGIPAEPFTQARFFILSQQMENDLQRLEHSHTSSHLARAVAYARAGLLDETEKEIRALQQQNPDSTLVRKLLAQVRQVKTSSLNPSGKQ